MKGKSDMEEKEMKQNRKLTAVLCIGIAVALLVIVALVFGHKKADNKENTIKVGEMTEVSAMDIMCEPSGVTLMEDGSLLVTDTYGKQIWKVKDKESTVYAGGETVEDPYGRPMGGYNDAVPEDSYFKYPWAIAPFLDGYAVSDTENNVVRLISEDFIQTINANTQEDLAMTDMGVAFSHPTGLASDEEGNLYIADTLEGAIRKVTPEGELTTFASGLSEPMGLCWKNGILYAAETGANRIIKLQNGKVELVAGSGTDGNQDGNAAVASFSMPQGIAVGDEGEVYVSDTGNSAIRFVKNGTVSTLAARDVDDLESFSPVSPVGIILVGNELYICDNFSRKLFVLSLQ